MEDFVLSTKSLIEKIENNYVVFGHNVTFIYGEPGMGKNVLAGIFMRKHYPYVHFVDLALDDHCLPGHYGQGSRHLIWKENDDHHDISQDQSIIIGNIQLANAESLYTFVRSARKYHVRVIMIGRTIHDLPCSEHCSPVQDWVRLYINLNEFMNTGYHNDFIDRR